MCVGGRLRTLARVGIRARGKNWLIADVLQNHLESLDPSGPRLVHGEREVRLGAYVFDYLAVNADGGLTAVLFEVSATRDVLGRLLLNAHALSNASGAKQVRSVLVTTHLDYVVIDLLSQLHTVYPTVVRLAEERGRRYELITPRLALPWGRGTQVTDRSRGPDFEAESARIRRLLQF